MDILKEVKEILLAEQKSDQTKASCCFGMDDIFVLYLAFYAALCNKFILKYDMQT